MSPPGMQGHGLNKTHLCSDGVTPSGEKLRDTRSVESSLRQTESCSQTGTTSSPERMRAVSDIVTHEATRRRGLTRR